MQALSSRSWQDWTFALGNLVLTAGLAPTLLDAQKPPVASALTIIPVLALFVVAEWTLRLRLAAAATVVQIAVWVVIGAQRGLQ